MREISGPEWDWLKQGELDQPGMSISTVLTRRLVELLDAKKENELLKTQITELMLRIQKMGVE